MSDRALDVEAISQRPSRARRDCFGNPVRGTSCVELTRAERDALVARARALTGALEQISTLQDALERINARTYSLDDAFVAAETMRTIARYALRSIAPIR